MQKKLTRNGLVTIAVLVVGLAVTPGPTPAHIVPPENLHPAAESYRRLGFLLRLNPVPWGEVERDVRQLTEALEAFDAHLADPVEAATSRLLAELPGPTARPIERERRERLATEIYRHSTRAVAEATLRLLSEARSHIDDYRAASGMLELARQLWAAFEPTVRATDPEAFRRLGECWLELSSALGHPGIAGVGARGPDRESFAGDAGEISEYLAASFGDRVRFPRIGPLVPLPAASPSFRRDAQLGARLPPGSQINKQLPRPRQVLNMAERGVDESETVLIALGDMAFDSALIFGDPARSLAITCNTCHNKSITNPNFFIPGLSARPGGMDVSNNFFAPHANNGHFDPVDIPDLRGIRFTSPYGRNGRFESLRDFTRNVIVNEFNGAEPDPLLLDGLIAYMLEFDFLPNPQLAADGTLNELASVEAKRGEEIFRRPFEQMGGRSCATCHDPTDHFLDRKRHDIGSVEGAVENSRDGALDTPTLLSSRYTAPYFHDGSLPTLASVVEWFDRRYRLGLSEGELSDLTRYLEAVGDGVEAYEDTIHTLEAELEEFSFFLSTYDFLKQRRKDELIATTMATIAFEIRAHKWDVQDRRHLPVLERLAELMDEARQAHVAGDVATADARVGEYQKLYEDNREVLK